MSHLIQMRQRIKSIETIKKVTHAMRLIAMSSHARLRSKKNGLELYKKELERLFSHVQQSIKGWHNETLSPSKDYSGPILIVLIGSQKGLCGIFNTLLFEFFEEELTKINRQQLQIITVGKKAYEYSQTQALNVIASYNELTTTTLSIVCNDITDRIVKAKKPYAHVSLFSNYPKTFFSQKPQRTVLIPFDLPEIKQETDLPEEYTFEQSPEILLDFLASRFLFSSISESLINSLIAESAARFIAMDNSTRNATNLLDDMKLDYNKLRQAKITRELTDLIGSL